MLFTEGDHNWCYFLGDFLRMCICVVFVYMLYLYTVRFINTYDTRYCLLRGKQHGIKKNLYRRSISINRSGIGLNGYNIK